MKLRPKKVALLLGGWLVLANLLIWLAQLNDLWLTKGLLFICLSLLPGIALLRAIRITPRSLLEGLVFSFGLSVLILMLSGLAANQILWYLGDQRPLELLGIAVAWNIITVACIIVGVVVNRQTVRLKTAWPRPSKTTMVLIVASLVLPVLATFGAFRLNNGGDWLVAGITLGWATTLIVYTFIFRNRLHDNTLAWCIFWVGLSILLMTSLRGWDITGHDIMREFRVYTLTHFSGHWDIGAYRDPYNACLSITILPEVYAKLMNISGLVVFKLLLQIIFAVTPVVVYIMLRGYVSKLGALVGCALFLSYPTFINDSAMLTRQGVAYLFFALALLAALRTPKEKIYKWLFVLCGLGVVLSHYSTSYMFVAIFAVAVISKLIIQWWRRWRLSLHSYEYTVLTPGFLALVVLATFLWHGQITGTSNGLLATISRSVANIPTMLSDDNKSSDTSAALLMASRKSQIDVYQSYLFTQATTSDILKAPQYVPQLAADETPVTPLGQKVNDRGVQPSITAELRQHFAKVLQLLAGLSVIFTTYISVFYATYLFGRKRPSALPLDLICLGMAGIALLLCMVALPNLSLNYGVLRTFQQSLIFLIIPLAIFLTIIGRFLGRRLRTTVVSVSIAALFLLFTGFFAQLLGGAGAALTLSNQGLYYGLYYTTKADLQAFDWIKTQLPKEADVRAASFAKAIMHDPKYPYKELGILPLQKPANSYVYLDQAQLVARKFYVYHEGSPLITTFPIDFYQDRTNQVYSTPTTGVFR